MEKKPLYGLDDSSRKFYIRVKKMFKELGLEVLEGDSAYFYMMKEGELYGQISTHVDDFNMAGEKEFIEDMVEKISGELKVSKVEHGQFRFTGIDFKKTSEGIEMSMEDYARSMEKIGAFRSGKNEPLTTLETKVYRKYTGKLMWLAENCRPDLSFTALAMSQKASKATVADLKKINKVVDRVHERESRVMFRKVADKEDLITFGVTDAAYSKIERPVGGSLVMLGSKKTRTAVPLFWKSKTIQKTCKSTKDAETRGMSKNVMNATFSSRMVETLLFGDHAGRIPVKVFSDSNPLLETLGSTKKIENTDLIPEIRYLKDKLMNGEVSCYAWLRSEENLADIFTKEMKENQEVRDLFILNTFKNGAREDNMVVKDGMELKMVNSVNRDD